jgi:hypothetical protein
VTHARLTHSDNNCRLQAEASEGPTVPGAYASFVSSLRADAAAASALATAGAHCRRGVEEAVHLLLSGRRDTGTAHVYTSGVRHHTIRVLPTAWGEWSVRF